MKTIPTINHSLLCLLRGKDVCSRLFCRACYRPNNTPAVGFSDAALPPDAKIGTWKNAGMGVFLDPATYLACLVHIQANTQVLSVLMAELNALLLRAKADALLLSHSFDWFLIVFWQPGTCSRIFRKCHGGYGQCFLKSNFSKIDIILKWSKFHDLKTLKRIASLCCSGQSNACC